MRLLNKNHFSVLKTYGLKPERLHPFRDGILFTSTKVIIYLAPISTPFSEILAIAAGIIRLPLKVGKVKAASSNASGVPPWFG